MTVKKEEQLHLFGEPIKTGVKRQSKKKVVEGFSIPRTVSELKRIDRLRSKGVSVPGMGYVHAIMHIKIMAIELLTEHHDEVLRREVVKKRKIFFERLENAKGKENPWDYFHELKEHYRQGDFIDYSRTDCDTIRKIKKNSNAAKAS